MSTALLLNLHLREPLVLSEGSAEGQQHASLDYIPGTTLLGACASQLGFDASSSLFRQLFLSPETRFLNAYPVRNGRRTLPVPLSAAADKENPARAIDRIFFSQDARGIAEAQAALGESGVQIKPVPGGFIDPVTLDKCAVRKRFQTHVGIDREKRRATDSILFGYESIDAGQQFSAVVLLENEDAAAALQEGLEKQGLLRLGRSRSAGYGAAAVTVSRTASYEEAESGQTDGQTHLLTLLSDYCGRPGMPVWDSLISDLSARLDGFDASCVAAVYTRTRVVRGFKGVWGLGRQAATVLVKGSVLKLKLENGCSPAPLQWSGLGQRRNEGFGRIQVDWSFHDALNQAKTMNSAAASGAATVAQLDRPAMEDQQHVTNIRKIVQQRLLEQYAEELCRVACASRRCSQEFVRDLARSSRLSNHQLANLRNVVNSGASLQKMLEWFDGVLEKSSGEGWKQAALPSLRGKRKQYMSHIVKEELLGASQDAAYNTAVGLLPEGSLKEAAQRQFGLDPNQANRLYGHVRRRFIETLVKETVSRRNREGEA